MAERKKYCVNGEWLSSKTDKWMPVTDSSTGEVIAEVPCCTAAEVESAIAAADAAFPAGVLSAAALTGQNRAARKI